MQKLGRHGALAACSFACASCLVLLLAEAVPSRGAVPVELREPGVIYIDDDLPEEIFLTLPSLTTVYGGRDLTGALATLAPGAKVKVVGMIEGMLLVSGHAGGNKVLGWIPAKSAPRIDPELLERIKAAELKRREITKAIKDRHVIRGMSFEDVKKAIGQPAKASYRDDESGRRDTWTYIKYEDQAQPQVSYDNYGRAYNTYTYVRVAVGEFTVDFAGGEVVSIEDHQRALPDSVRSTVPVPQKPSN